MSTAGRTKIKAGGPRHARGNHAWPPAAPRFFYALRPEPEAAAALAALAARLAEQAGGRALAACDIHLTLAFVGARDAADVGRLAGLLDGLMPNQPGGPMPHTAHGLNSPTPTPVPLSRIGAFGPKLLWIGPPQPIPWVEKLSLELRRRLTAAGIAHDERPLRAHVTLLRGARHATAARAAVAPIVPAGWALCLGWSGPASTPQRRYDWHCHHTVKLAS